MKTDEYGTMTFPESEFDEEVPALQYILDNCRGAAVVPGRILHKLYLARNGDGRYLGFDEVHTEEGGFIRLRYIGQDGCVVTVSPVREKVEFTPAEMARGEQFKNLKDGEEAVWFAGDLEFTLKARAR